MLRYIGYKVPVEKLKEVNVIEGDTVILSCNPPSNNTLNWLRDGDIELDTRNNIEKRENGFLLVVKNVSAIDAGTYTCTQGAYKHSILLRVTVKVIIKMRLRILNWNFVEEFKNKSSKAYRNFESNFTTELTKLFKDVPGFERVEILEIWNGSLRVRFRVIVKYIFNSSADSTTNIKVEVTNTVIIRAKEGWVGRLKVDKSPEELEISTPPPAPTDARVTETRAENVVIEWLPPSNHEYYRVDGYRVRYWPHASKTKEETGILKGKNYKLTGLNSATDYNAHIFAVNRYGDGLNSGFIFTTTEGGMKAWEIILIVLAIIAVACFIAFVIYCLCRKNNRLIEKEDQEHGESEHAGMMMKIRDKVDEEEIGTPTLSSYTNLVTLQPPGNCKVFPRSDLLLFNELGSGAFGVVYKGSLTEMDGNVVQCAVKAIKGSASEEDRRDMYKELDIMSSVGYHPNLINLIGACTDEGQLLIIVEFAGKGCLLDVLKAQQTVAKEHAYQNLVESETNEFSLDFQTKIRIAVDVAKGMNHLTKQRCVHRDLAARNVLLTDKYVAKVADFGMSRDIYETGEYEKTTAGKLPTRWMAIESLETRRFTIESDLWSFGVLLWEIETKGLMPHPGLTFRELLDKQKSGYRLEQPSGCSDEIYEIMRLCWLGNPKDRPTFDQLCSKLSLLLPKDECRDDMDEDYQRDEEAVETSQTDEAKRGEARENAA